MPEIYLDVLIFENLVMNYLILYITSRFFKRNTKPWKLLMGSGIGTAYAVAVLWIPQHNAAAIAGKLILSAVMIAATFYPKTVRAFLKLTVCFYTVTFLFAGAAFAVILATSSEAAFAGGAFYLHWNSPVNYLLITAGSGYIIVNSFVRYIKDRRMLEKCAVSLYVEFNGEGVWIPALVDTGNELKDPFTGEPVVIVELSAVQSLLPERLRQYFQDHSAADLDAVETVLEETEWVRRFRLIPYSSLGCESGVLPGFRADLVKILQGGIPEQETAEAAAQNLRTGRENAIICLYTKKLSDGSRYRALLAPELLAEPSA